MPDVLRDCVQVKRLMLGRLGSMSDLYGNMALEGKASDVLNSVEAFLGMYSHEPQLRFYDLAGTSLTAEWFLERIPGYDFTKPQQVIAAEQLALIEQTHPDWRDEKVGDRLWEAAQEALTDFGLPVSFFSCQMGFEGAHNVVFWYPRLVPAEGMLMAFQAAVAQAQSA